MRKIVVGVVLTGLLVVVAAVQRASTQAPTFCPMKCCSGPHDCPTPSCCAHR